MEDVGAQGEWPVHPELLDWLAVEFREGGWDIKHMVKLMVMSAAYRQDLAAPARAARASTRTIGWLAYQSPRRLEAEFVRDNALAIAGLLNLDMGGPSVYPYQPAGYYANCSFPTAIMSPSATTASIAAASTCTGSGHSSTRCWRISTPRPAKNARPTATSPTRPSRP